jgi:hypothetical protein
MSNLNTKGFRRPSGGPGDEKKGFKTNFGGPCVFACENGNKAVPKRRHVPNFDGCGFPMAVNGFNYETTRFDFTGCCNEQDRCYNTCGRTKEECDDKFGGCAEAMCKDMFGEDQPEGSDAKKEFDECTKKGNTFRSLSKIMGCTMYLEGQADGCSCKNGDDEPVKKPKLTNGRRGDGSSSSKKQKRKRRAVVEEHDEL